MPASGLIGLALAALALGSVPAAASLDATGRWTAPTWDWGWTAVHLLLVPPGSSGYHSRVVWWEDDHRLTQFKGGMWGWTMTPGADCAASADSLFTPLPMGPDPTADVFCAGQAQLKDGRILVTGGTENGEVGIPNTFVFDPDATANKWLPQPDLVYPRWYPTNTRLADGTMLVTSGTQYSHEEFFGGRITGTATLDANLRRLGCSLGGVWDTPRHETADPSFPWPAPLEGATLASIDWGYDESDGFLATQHVVNMMFGGDVIDASGHQRSIGDAWFPTRSNQVTASDYGYYFKNVLQKFVPDARTRPDSLPRSDHVIVSASRSPADSNSSFVFGGRRFVPGRRTVTLGDLWRLYWHVEPTDSSRTGWTWQSFGTLPGGPSPRFGHAAIYDPFHRRVLVFGGTFDGRTALDDSLYALDVSDPRHPRWRSTVVTGDRPAARFGLRMGLDLFARARVVSPGDTLKDQYGAVMFGGRTATGLDDQAYVLWLNNDPDSLRVEWRRVATTGEVPGVTPAGRVFATFTKDVLNDRWVLFGGDIGGAPDLRAWALKFTFGDASQASWRRLDQDADASTTDGVAQFDPDGVFQRVAEQYSVDGSIRTAHSNTRLLQEWYPFQWVLPDSTVFSLSISDTSFRLVSPGGAWTQFPAGDAAGEGANGGSGVMFRPGKVLTAGTRTGGSAPSARAQWIEPLAPDARWRPTANAMRYGRSNLNLVMLPTGQVLAVGGTWQIGGESDTAAVRTPELFDPDYIDPVSGLHGRWYDADTLAPQAMCRDYHSTALLLPDGRILSTGGNSTTDRIKAEIFCPPYLFRHDGSLAPRPSIDSPPQSLRYGRSFTILTSQPTRVTRVSLLAPGAPTHAFDQNERFIPLTFSAATDPPRLTVDAPGGAGNAPPGWYLLFLTGSADAAGAYPDVPSVAQWVQVGGEPSPCVGAPPDSMQSLSVDAVSSNAVYLYWDGPPAGDPSLIRCPVTAFDMRYRLDPFVPLDPLSWDLAAQSNDETSPDASNPRAGGSGSAQDLDPATTYYFTVRAEDDAPVDFTGVMNHAVVYARTMGRSDIASGGGDAPPISILPDATRAASPARMSGRASATELVAATSRSSDGGWRVTLRSEAAPAAPAPGAKAPRSTLTAPIHPGVVPRRLAGLPRDNRLGLCALHDGGAIAAPTGYALERIARTFATSMGRYQLESAWHSRSGPVDLAGAAGGMPGLASGDSLVLIYRPAAKAPDAESWYASLAGSAAASSGQSGSSLPVAFALGQNAPNPFGGTTRIRFDLPIASPVRIEVFDLFGRRVRTLTDQAWPAGYHQVEWDRRDSNGAPLRSGVFVYRMIAGSFRDHRKLVIVGE